MTTAEAIGRMEAEQVPCGVVIAPAELPTTRTSRPSACSRSPSTRSPAALRQPRHPARFGGTPAALGGPAPTLGEHTDEILEELGMSDRTAALRAAGVVA